LNLAIRSVPPAKITVLYISLERIEQAWVRSVGAMKSFSNMIGLPLLANDLGVLRKSIS
jgi:hypothetical protein